MPTKNPRINITFEEATAGLLNSLAKQEHKSVSSLAKELILEALERREDMVLSSLAKVRDEQNVKKIKHDDAWK
jgi:predicted CopG family antitoxin